MKVTLNLIIDIPDSPEEFAQEMHDYDPNYAWLVEDAICSRMMDEFDKLDFSLVSDDYKKRYEKHFDELCE